MESERNLPVRDRYAYQDLPEKPIRIAKEVILTVLGTTIAGANAEAVRHCASGAAVGWKERSHYSHACGKVPAYNAALVNSAMARALDFCDGMVPGCTSVPPLFRLLWRPQNWQGLHRQGVSYRHCPGNRDSIEVEFYFRVRWFRPDRSLHHLWGHAIAAGYFVSTQSRCWMLWPWPSTEPGEVMQSNIDGSLAVRVIQGFVSQSGIISRNSPGEVLPAQEFS